MHAPELSEPHRSLNDRVREEQIALLYRQLPPALLATAVNATLLAAVLWGQVDRGRILAWVAVTLVLSAARYGLIGAYRRRTAESDVPWSGLFLLGVALAGCTWGSAAAFLFPTGSPGHQAFLALILCGMSTAAVASLGSLLSAFLWFLVPAITPLAVRFFLLDGSGALGMGVLALCFGLLMTMVARRFNHSVKESLALRFENVELIERLSVARREAEAASRSKSQFLANMSHEIRTPMNGVLGMLELLRTTPLDDKQEHFAGTAHRSGLALLHVINDILDFSKIESGLLELERIDFSVREVVEETAEFLAERAHRKGLELLCFVGESVPDAAVGDPHRLRQILTNLVGNAIKFTDEGEVSIRVSAEPDEGSAYRLSIEIRDTGIGIEEEARARIFESFTQADSATTRRHGGTGLGLAITRQLVVSMGGSIALESELGRGTTFRAEVLVGESEKRFAKERLGETLRSLRALIVDDNATNRSILEHQMTRFGVENASVPDAVTGLKRLLSAAEAGRPFDLAILDMSMPGMDGIQMARAIRSQPALTELRLLMLTSVGEYGDAELARRAGIEVYLTKPVRQSHLYDSLVGLMAGMPRRVRATEPAQAREHAQAIGLRVLLAEDHRVNQEVALAMLEGFGCTVTLARNGAEAVEQVGTETFDVILMDCQMPTMDGFEATREILERLGAEAPPIIALTAHAAEGDREDCLAAGMSAYVSKPFSRDELLTALTRVASVSSIDEVGLEPAEVQAGGVGILDESALDRLRALRSDSHPDVVERVLQLYLNDSQVLVTVMKSATEEGDIESVGRAAHSLKSCSANLGAIDLSELCRSIESVAKSGEVSGLGELVREVDRLQVEVFREVERRLDEA